MDDLIAFLRARLDDDTRMALAARDPWFGYEPDEHVERVKWADALHIARHSPNRVLAEVDAKRRILDEHPATVGWDGNSHDGTVCGTCSMNDDSGALDGDPYPCPTLRLLALPYADHPAYQDAWRP